MRYLITFMFAVVVLARGATACLWDYDTLRDERRGLPGIAEILAGRWERHSAFFYEDRLRRMEALIAREPGNLDAYDNLAVAHEKLGHLDRAIETMLVKDKLKPGAYTTHANLGTFYLHGDRLDEGIAEITLALAINPDAHFGREKYQLLLANHLLAKAKGDASLGETFISMRYPTKPARLARPSTTSPADHAAWRAQVDEQRPAMAKWAREAQQVRDAWVADREHAIEGIVGMIRFGTGTSPDLYAALGELLSDRRDAHLAYRAFERARDLGFHRPEWLAERMSEVSEMSEDKSEFDAALIDRERSDAKAWVTAYQAFEDDLIRRGKDPADESLLAPFYAAHDTARETPAVSPVEARRNVARWSFRSIVIAGGVAISVVIVGGVALLVGVPKMMRFVRRRLGRRRINFGEAGLS